MIGEMIEAGAREMGIALPEGAGERFARFQALIIEASTRMNLTRVPDDEREAADRNYLDSLAPLAAGLLAGVKSAIDVGAGAGFPGVPLAIALPGTRFTLLDSLGKRVKFLEDAVCQLALGARAVHARAEEAARLAEYRDAFDVAVARAVAPLNVLAELALPFVRPGGKLVAYKGPTAGEELAAARAAIARLGGGECRVIDVAIPDRDWRHSLVVINKARPTPAAFPRKPGEAERRPIA